MAFAAASAGAILSLPLAPPVKDKPDEKGGSATVKRSCAALTLLREQEQLEAWTAATVGLPVDLESDSLDSSAYYVQVHSEIKV